MTPYHPDYLQHADLAKAAEASGPVAWDGPPAPHPRDGPGGRGARPGRPPRRRTMGRDGRDPRRRRALDGRRGRAQRRRGPALAQDRLVARLPGASRRDRGLGGAAARGRATRASRERRRRSGGGAAQPGAAARVDAPCELRAERRRIHAPRRAPQRRLLERRRERRARRPGRARLRDLPADRQAEGLPLERLADAGRPGPSPGARGIPSRASRIPTGRLVWLALGDPAFLPSPHGSGWVPNRLVVAESELGAPTLPVPDDALAPEPGTGRLAEGRRGPPGGRARAVPRPRLALSRRDDAPGRGPPVRARLRVAREGAGGRARDGTAARGPRRASRPPRRDRRARVRGRQAHLRGADRRGLRRPAGRPARGGSPDGPALDHRPVALLALIEEAAGRGLAAFSREAAEARGLPWLDLVRDAGLAPALRALLDELERKRPRAAGAGRPRHARRGAGALGGAPRLSRRRRPPPRDQRPVPPGRVERGEDGAPGVPGSLVSARRRRLQQPRDAPPRLRHRRRRARRHARRARRRGARGAVRAGTADRPRALREAGRGAGPPEPAGRPLRRGRAGRRGGRHRGRCPRSIRATSRSTSAP